MTVSSLTNKASFSANGSTTVFAYNFKIFADADLEVISRAADGTETIKTLSTHYNVSGAGSDSGGNVTFTSGNTPANGTSVIIRRSLALTQSTDYVENDTFAAENHEDALDRLTFVTQSLQEQLDRTFKVSKTTTITTPEVVEASADRASKALVFSSDGNALEIGPTASQITTAQTSATNASNSADAAASSASAASTSATNAANSASSINTANFVAKTSATGSAGIPVGTTAQRDGSPATGYFRYNSTLTQFEGYDGSAWGQIGVGESAASATASGIVELATSAEVTTGTDTVRSVTPAGLHAGLAGLTDTTITAADAIIFSDATDSGKLKEDTVQGILDLALPYVAPSTSGNVLTSNGSAWTSAAAPGGAWEFVEKQTASSSTTLTFSHTIEAGYDYVISAHSIKNSVDVADGSAHVAQYGTGAGPTFVTATYKNNGARQDTTVLDAQVGTVTTGFQWHVKGTIGGAGAGELWHGEMLIYNPASNERTYAQTHMVAGNSAATTQPVGHWSVSLHNTAAVVTALRVVATTGNFTTGDFILYRRVQA